MGLPIYLAELRAKGTVRRYAILPLPGWIFAVAVLLSTLLLVTCASLIITAVIGIRDGLRPEVLNPQFIGLLIGCILWLSALGFFLGALRISSRTTQALSAVLFFTLFFGSGAAVPIDGLPEMVQNILDWNPLKQWLEVIVAVYIGATPTTTQYLRLLMAIPLTLVCSIAGLQLWKQRG